VALTLGKMKMYSRITRGYFILWIMSLICLVIFGFLSIRHNNLFSYNSHAYGTFTLRSGWSSIDFLWTIPEEARFQVQGFEAEVGKEIRGCTSDLRYAGSNEKPPSYWSFFTALPDISKDEYGLVVGIPYFWLILITVFLWAWRDHRQNRKNQNTQQDSPPNDSP
jgi:hypothetical protein